MKLEGLELKIQLMDKFITPFLMKQQKSGRNTEEVAVVPVYLLIGSCCDDAKLRWLTRKVTHLGYDGDLVELVSR